MDYPKTVPGVGLVAGKFVDENETTGVVGSLIPAPWGNAVTEELLAVMADGGEAPDEQQHNQVAKALRKLRRAAHFGVWRFSAGGANPAPGSVTINSADPALATELLLAESSADGLDYSSCFGMLRAGDAVVFQERDSAAVAHRFRVTGPAVDNGQYRTIPVVYVAGSGGSPAADSYIGVLLAFTSAPVDQALLNRVTALEGRQRATGDGQDWVNCTGSRALSTTYTNTTDQTIVVKVSVTVSTSSGGSLAAQIGGNAVSYGTQCYLGSAPSSNEVEVQPGKTYRFYMNSGSGSVLSWWELRK